MAVDTFLKVCQWCEEKHLKYFFASKILNKAEKQNPRPPNKVHLNIVMISAFGPSASDLTKRQVQLSVVDQVMQYEQYLTI